MSTKLCIHSQTIHFQSEKTFASTMQELHFGTFAVFSNHRGIVVQDVRNICGIVNKTWKAPSARMMVRINECFWIVSTLRDTVKYAKQEVVSVFQCFGMYENYKKIFKEKEIFK